MNWFESLTMGALSLAVMALVWLIIVSILWICASLFIFGLVASVRRIANFFE